MKRNERGVTLIALVVTIVVLLILAGTAIAMLSGDDGIMTNAQKAQAANTEGEIREKIKMAYNAVKTKISVDSAIDPDYDATDATTMNALFLEAAKEIGIEIPASVTTGTADGLTITFDSSNKRITFLYKDNKFGGTTASPDMTSETIGNDTYTNGTTLPTGNQKVDGKNLHPIRAEITFETDNARFNIDAEQVL